MVTRTLNTYGGGVEWSRRKLKNFTKDGINKKSVGGLRDINVPRLPMLNDNNMAVCIFSRGTTLLSYCETPLFPLFSTVCFPSASSLSGFIRAGSES